MKMNWHIGLLAAGSLAALTATLLSAQTPTAQPTFATPEEAIHAVGDAAEHNDTAAMLKLFGPAGKDLVEPAEDAGARENRANFAKMLHERMQIERDSTNPNRVTFAVGAEDWPFPIPLARNRLDFEAIPDDMHYSEHHLRNTDALIGPVGDGDSSYRSRCSATGSCASWTRPIRGCGRAADARRPRPLPHAVRSSGGTHVGPTDRVMDELSVRRYVRGGYRGVPAVAVPHQRDRPRRGHPGTASATNGRAAGPDRGRAAVRPGGADRIPSNTRNS